MSTRRHGRAFAPARIPAVAAMLLAAALHAAAAEVAGTPAEDGSEAATDVSQEATPTSSVQVLGDGDQRIYVVDHGATWSMHVENVPVYSLFDSWHQAGGPVVISKALLDYSFTLSLHRVAPERIVERILEGYGHTLHYDANGRLEQVRVYSPAPTRIFKAPRLVEGLARWREAESPPAPSDAPAPPASSPADAAPAP